MRIRRAVEVGAFLLLVGVARGRDAAPGVALRAPGVAPRTPAAATPWTPPAAATLDLAPTCEERLAACRMECGLDPIPFADPAGEAVRMAVALQEATRDCELWDPNGTVVDCTEQPCLACRVGPSGDDDPLLTPLACPGVRRLSNALITTRTGPGTGADGRGPPMRVACVLLDPAADLDPGPRVSDRMDALMAEQAPADTGVDTGW